MTRAQQGKAKQRKRRKAEQGALAAHPAFAPILGLWGVLLAGSAVMVMPSALILSSANGTFLATLGTLAQPVVAVLAAMLLGGTLFVLAAGVSKRSRRRAAAPSVAEMAVRRVHPIDPVRDLGSLSLDEPLGAVPMATPVRQDPAGDPSQPASGNHPEPLALDLSEFSEFPGRNAVWVEDAAPVAVAVDAEIEAEVEATSADGTPPVALPRVSPAVTPLREPAPLPEPGTAALARLRAVPPSELSLAEMVERFAGALHEHRASPPVRALSAADLAAREAALAEALKALAALSGEEASASVREPLRAALAQFQGPRRAGGGAA